MTTLHRSALCLDVLQLQPAVQKIAPKHKIGTSLVLNNRKPFAQWLYARLDAEGREFLQALEQHKPQAVHEHVWPLMHGYLRDHCSMEVKASERLLDLANMTMPQTWYPLATSMRRRVIYHAGPTNSGKTYTALQVRAAPPPPRARCAPQSCVTLSLPL